MTEHRKPLPDGRIAEITLLTFGRARIIIGDGYTFVDDSY